MGKLENITLGLPADQIALLEEAVRSGEYASADDLVAEALLEWQVRHTPPGEPEGARLGALWDEGKASGTPVALDMTDLREEARRRASIGR